MSTSRPYSSLQKPLSLCRKRPRTDYLRELRRRGGKRTSRSRSRLSFFFFFRTPIRRRPMLVVGVGSSSPLCHLSRKSHLRRRRWRREGRPERDSRAAAAASGRWAAASRRQRRPSMTTKTKKRQLPTPPPPTEPSAAATATTTSSSALQSSILPRQNLPRWKATTLLLLLVRLEGEIAEPARGRRRRGQRAAAAAAERRSCESSASMSIFSIAATERSFSTFSTPEGEDAPRFQSEGRQESVLSHPDQNRNKKRARDERARNGSEKRDCADADADAFLISEESSERERRRKRGSDVAFHFFFPRTRRVVGFCDDSYFFFFFFFFFQISPLHVLKIHAENDGLLDVQSQVYCRYVRLVIGSR